MLLHLQQSLLNSIVDGLRIDTVKHVQKSFWPDFNEAAGVYCVGEVFDGDVAFSCPYQNSMDGLLNYPLYRLLTDKKKSNADAVPLGTTP